ncbi:MAG TPA: TetR/AcrR family transcriptional regulator [Acidimicrobiales bacterium]
MTHDGARSGRPRDPGRDAAILTATLDLLGEVGYEQLTVRAIAQRAGAGLATIYRRWPTKEDLVVDAVASAPDMPAPGDLDRDPAENLQNLVSSLVEALQGPRRALMPTLVGQLPHNPELAEILRTRIVLPRLAAVTEQLAAVPGVRPERVREAAELIPASLFFQSLVLGRRLGRAAVRRAIAEAIAAARRPGAERP